MVAFGGAFTALEVQLPRSLKNCVLDIPTIFLLTVINLSMYYMAIVLLATVGQEQNFDRLLILFMLGFPFFSFGTIVAGLKVDVFLNFDEVEHLFRGIAIGFIVMFGLAMLCQSLADKITLATMLGMSTVGTFTLFFAVSAAINEEWMLANLQRTLTLGFDGEPVVLVGIIVRGLVFWGLHRPYAYAGAPMALQLSIFTSGLALGFVFAYTKHFSVTIMCHILWNVLAVM